MKTPPGPPATVYYALERDPHTRAGTTAQALIAYQLDLLYAPRPGAYLPPAGGVEEARMIEDDWSSYWTIGPMVYADANQALERVRAIMETGAGADLVCITFDAVRDATYAHLAKLRALEAQQATAPATPAQKALAQILALPLTTPAYPAVVQRLARLGLEGKPLPPTPGSDR